MPRQSIFGDKNARSASRKVQGYITAHGLRAFERQRAKLAKLAKRPVDKVSDADTIEYLSRGEEETIRVLNGPDIGTRK